MDKYTFGNSKAAVNLISILEEPENKIYARRAASILARFLDSCASLRFISHEGTRKTVLHMWLERFVSQVEGCAEFPYLVKTHLCTVATTQYRKVLAGRL